VPDTNNKGRRFERDLSRPRDALSRDGGGAKAHEAGLDAGCSVPRMFRLLLRALSISGYLLVASCTVGAMPTTESTGVQCSDERDNDADGLADCEDPDCGVHAMCGGGPADAAGLDGGGLADRELPPPVPCTAPIDIVFVIDVSTSMDDEIDAIRQGIGSIADAAMMLTPDVQFGLVVFVDDVVAVNDCRPFATIDLLQSELQRWQTFTSSNDQPAGGTEDNLDCEENSLDALHAAATMCPWRTDATHVAIHVTDDTFEEAPYVLSEDFLFGGGIEVEHTYAETVGALTAQQVRVGAFAMMGEGTECAVGSSSDVGRGFHGTFEGMPSIPSATGGRAWDLAAVQSGDLDMAVEINGFTLAEHCTLY
jgi:hypothetical protein